MSAEEIRSRTPVGLGQFLQHRVRSGSVLGLSSRAGLVWHFVLISKIYRQMYADTGIATDSARVSRSAQWARWLAKPCQRLFAADPMPHLKLPETWVVPSSTEQVSSAG